MTGGRAPYAWAGSLLVMLEPTPTLERFGDVDGECLEAARIWFHTYNPVPGGWKFRPMGRS